MISTIKSLFPITSISNQLTPSDYKICEKLLSHAKTLGSLKANHEYCISLDELLSGNNIENKTLEKASIKLVLMRIVALSIQCTIEYHDGTTGPGFVSVLDSISMRDDNIFYCFTALYVKSCLK